MPKIPDADKDKIAKAFKDTLRLFAIAGNSISSLVRISSGDNVCIRIFNATRADTITGGLAKKRRSRKSEDNQKG